MEENKIMKEEPLHRDCPKHTAENCDINEHHNLEPVLDDCGHRVESGPGKDKPKVEGGAPIWQHQDPNKGPGVK